jgi:23S rRNA A2030 N6-methylase RlmJ
MKGVMLSWIPTREMAFTTSHLTKRDRAPRDAKGAASGIAKVLEKLNDETVPWPLRDYIELAQRFDRKHRNDKEQGEASLLRFYPGSPSITQMTLRTQDKHVLFALSRPHFQDIELLQDSEIEIFRENGVSKAPDVIKKDREKEYLCIIDPPYEEEHESIEILEAVQRIVAWDAHITVMLWIPIVSGETK